MLHVHSQRFVYSIVPAISIVIASIIYRICLENIELLSAASAVDPADAAAAKAQTDLIPRYKTTAYVAIALVIFAFIGIGISFPYKRRVIPAIIMLVSIGALGCAVSIPWIGYVLDSTNAFNTALTSSTASGYIIGALIVLGYLGIGTALLFDKSLKSSSGGANTKMMPYTIAVFLGGASLVGSWFVERQESIAQNYGSKALLTFGWLTYAAINSVD